MYTAASSHGLVGGTWAVVEITVTRTSLDMRVNAAHCAPTRLQVGAAAPAHAALRGAFVLGGEGCAPVIIADAWVQPCAAPVGPPRLYAPPPELGAVLVDDAAVASSPACSINAMRATLALLCDGAAASGAVCERARTSGVTRAVIALGCDASRAHLRIVALRTARALTLASPAPRIAPPVLHEATALVARLWALIAAPAALRLGSMSAGPPAVTAVHIAHEAAEFLREMLGSAAYGDAVRDFLQTRLQVISEISGAISARKHGFGITPRTKFAPRAGQQDREGAMATSAAYGDAIACLTLLGDGFGGVVHGRRVDLINGSDGGVVVYVDWGSRSHGVLHDSASLDSPAMINASEVFPPEPQPLPTSVGAALRPLAAEISRVLCSVLCKESAVVGDDDAAFAELRARASVVARVHAQWLVADAANAAGSGALLRALVATAGAPSSGGTRSPLRVLSAAARAVEASLTEFAMSRCASDSRGASARTGGECRDGQRGPRTFGSEANMDAHRRSGRSTSPGPAEVVAEMDGARYAGVSAEQPGGSPIYRPSSGVHSSPTYRPTSPPSVYMPTSVHAEVERLHLSHARSPPVRAIPASIGGGPHPAPVSATASAAETTAHLPARAVSVGGALQLRTRGACCICLCVADHCVACRSCRGRSGGGCTFKHRASARTSVIPSYAAATRSSRRATHDVERHCSARYVHVSVCLRG